MHEGEEQNSSEAKEIIRQDLLKQGKGQEAIQYALKEGLPFGDQDVFDALRSVLDAQDRAEKAGNADEFNRLQTEYDNIYSWRLKE